MKHLIIPLSLAAGFFALLRFNCFEWHLRRRYRQSSAQLSGLLAHLKACQQTDVTRRATNAFIRSAACST
jgi:hypothetical protein